MQQHSVPTVVELCRKQVDLHTESCINPTGRRQRPVTVSLISSVSVIVKLFATVEVESNMFDRCWKCETSDLACCQKIRRGYVLLCKGTMVDHPTVRFGAANVDCRCLVVTQMQSVLSTLSLSLLDCIHLHRTQIQAENVRVSEFTFTGCNRNKPAYRRHSSDSTDHDAI